MIKFNKKLYNFLFAIVDCNRLTIQPTISLIIKSLKIHVNSNYELFAALQHTLIYNKLVVKIQSNDCNSNSFTLRKFAHNNQILFQRTLIFTNINSKKIIKKFMIFY